MSACISKHGEFSEHDPGSVGAERFVCRLCGVFDEGAVLQRLADLELAYELKAADFARETLRTSAALQACAADPPQVVVGEAGLGYIAAQKDIAKAIHEAGDLGGE